MRIILHNPHADDFMGIPLAYFLSRKKALKKYYYLLDGVRRCPSQFLVYADGSSSSLLPNPFFSGLPYFLRKVFLRFELLFWMMINRINPFGVEVHIGRLDPTRGDVLISFTYRNAAESFASDGVAMSRFEIKLLHLSHYMVRTAEKAENCRALGGVIFLAEDNLARRSDYFQKYFGWYRKDVYILPFSPQARFVNRKSFSSRYNRCVATGTFHDLSKEPHREFYSDFMNYFGVNCYHPMRKTLSESAASVAGKIDVRTSNFMEAGAKPVHEAKTDSNLRRLYKRVCNSLRYRQRAYFKFDIVDLYNSYRMAVVPEEINGLPAIGFVESMACGCAYIGKVGGMYSSIGLKEGVHYIGYDGSIEQLIDVVSFYQAHEGLTERIARQGEEFIRNRFSSQRVLETFLADLGQLFADSNLRQEEAQILKSSFVIG